MSIDAVTNYGLDMTGATDNAPKLVALYNDIAARAAAGKQMPRVLFSEGTLAFSAFPRFPFGNLQLVADGQVILQHTGNGDAITLGNDNVNNGTWGYRFDGFHIQRGPNTQNGLVLRAIHDADIVNVTVSGANAPQQMNASGVYTAGIKLVFCMCTELRRPAVAGFGEGLVFDYDPNYPQDPSAVCRVIQPTINGCAYGLVFKSGNMNYVCDVNFEGNQIAIYFPNVPSNINPAGHNHIERGDLEQNATDIVIESPAHYNKIELPGNPPKASISVEALLTNRVVSSEPLL